MVDLVTGEETGPVVLGKKNNLKKPILFLSLAIALIILSGLGLYFFNNAGSTGNLNSNTVVSEIDNGEVISESESNPISLQVSEVMASEGRITGKLVVENKQSFGYKDLIYTTSLVGEPVLSTSELGDQQVSVMEDPFPAAFSDSELFSLSAGEKKEISLDMAYPSGMPAGLYTLSVSLVPGDEHILAKQVFPINIESSGEFLSIVPGSCKLDIDNVKFDANSGANVNPAEVPSAFCDVKNSTTKTIVAKAEVLQAERYVYGYPESEILKVDGQENFTFEPGQTERVSFRLPEMVKPQVYEGVGRLIDSQGRLLSAQAPFRWVVRGQSAVVKSAEMSNHNLSAGDDVEVSVVAAPSMDLFWRRSVPNNYPNRSAYSLDEGTLLQQPKLEVSVSSGEDICAKQLIDLPSNTVNWEEQKIQLKSDIQCTDPVLITKIYEGETELAALEKSYLSDFSSKTAQNFLNPLTYVVLAVVGVILLIGIVLIVYFSKKGKKGQTPLVGLLLLLSLVAVGSAYLGFSKVVFGDIVKGPAETEGIPYNQRNVWMERDGRSQGLNFQGFRQVTGGNSTASLNGNSIDVSADIYTLSSFGCGNYNLAYMVYVYIDGQGAYVNGGSNNTMLRITRNTNSQQTLVTTFNASLPGVDLTTGRHTLEVRLVPVEVYYGGSWQITGTSTDLPLNSGDTNCGSSNQACYGSLKLDWGQSATFSVSGNVGGFSNQTVQLMNSSGNVIGQAVSNSGGGYGFTITSAGVYAVRLITTPPGYTLSGPSQSEFGVREDTYNGNRVLYYYNTGSR